MVSSPKSRWLHPLPRMIANPLYFSFASGRSAGLQGGLTQHRGPRAARGPRRAWSREARDGAPLHPRRGTGGGARARRVPRSREVGGRALTGQPTSGSSTRNRSLGRGGAPRSGRLALRPRQGVGDAVHRGGRREIPRAFRIVGMMSTDRTGARCPCSQPGAAEDDRDLLGRPLDAAVVARNGVRRVVGQRGDQVGTVVRGLGVDQLLGVRPEPPCARPGWASGPSGPARPACSGRRRCRQTAVTSGMPSMISAASATFSDDWSNNHTFSMSRCRTSRGSPFRQRLQRRLRPVVVARRSRRRRSTS